MTKTHETVRAMTDGQRSDIIATMVTAMPRLNFDQAQAIVGNKGPFVAGIGAAFKPYLGQKPTAVPVPQPTVPADGVEFELTLDATDPMEMVRSDGYDPADWKFTGSSVVPQTCRFKLVRVGRCANLNEVRGKLAQHGPIPEGHWREAFKKAFPRNDGQGPIGFADPSWVSPGGNSLFPVLGGLGKAWDSYFLWAGFDHVERWRWLVASLPTGQAGK